MQLIVFINTSSTYSIHILFILHHSPSTFTDLCPSLERVSQSSFIDGLGHFHYAWIGFLLVLLNLITGQGNNKRCTPDKQFLSLTVEKKFIYYHYRSF